MNKEERLKAARKKLRNYTSKNPNDWARSKESAITELMVDFAQEQVTKALKEFKEDKLKEWTDKTIKITCSRIHQPATDACIYRETGMKAMRDLILKESET